MYGRNAPARSGRYPGIFAAQSLRVQTVTLNQKQRHVQSKPLSPHSLRSICTSKGSHSTCSGRYSSASTQPMAT